MANSLALKRVDRQRLERLAREVGCSANEILRDVLRDGFDYTECRIRALNEGFVDLHSERFLTLDEIRARLQGRRAIMPAQVVKPLGFLRPDNVEESRSLV